MKSKRLVQIIFYNDPDGYPPIINGIWQLTRNEWDVEVLCRDSVTRWNVPYPSTAKVHRIGTAGLGSWQEYLVFVTRVLRYGSKHASLIYAHDMHALVPGRILATVNNCPLIYHSHDFVEATANIPAGSKAVYLFQQFFARTAKQVVVPDADRAKVISNSLYLKRPPLIVANAPLKKPFVANSILRDRLAEKGYDFAKIVFRQGRIGIGHAIEATIRSIPKWDNKRAGFVLMGIGDPDYLESLSNLAQSLAVSNQFAILPAVSYAQVASFTGGADVGHALYEPMHVNNVHITTASNKIMEYMAAGLPLLVSDRASLVSHVKRYGCGVVADEGSPERIALAINKLLNDSQQAKAMGFAGRNAFEQEFCYDIQFEKVLREFENLIRK